MKLLPFLAHAHPDRFLLELPVLLRVHCTWFLTFLPLPAYISPEMARLLEHRAWFLDLLRFPARLCPFTALRSTTTLTTFP